MANGHSEQYERTCKERFDRVEANNKENSDKLNDVHRIVTNGLVNKVYDNHEWLKRLDNRLWALMGGIVLSILLQILFQVLR